MKRVFVLLIFSMFLAIMFVNTNCAGVEDIATNTNNNTGCPPVTDLILTNTTGADPSGRFTGSLQSNIVIAYNDSNWVATNSGWDEDECLASPTHILDYAKGEWNRIHKGAYQFVTFPVCGINNCESASDSVCPLASAEGTKGDLSELWFTWDTNWVYVGVKSQLENGFDTGNGAGTGVNIMVLFDRERNEGITNFVEQAWWDKAIYTTDFDTDLYVGAFGGYGGVSALSLGGAEVRVYDSSVDTLKAKRSPADPPSELWPAAFEAYYNGDNETDVDERVLLFKIRMDLFTNTMSTVSSVTLKIIALSVDGSCGAGATTYDFLPDSKSAMSGSGANVADNYFLVPFTDADGKVLTNIRPKYDSKIKFLPGSVQ